MAGAGQDRAGESSAAPARQLATIAGRRFKTRHTILLQSCRRPRRVPLTEYLFQRRVRPIRGRQRSMRLARTEPMGISHDRLRRPGCDRHPDRSRAAAFDFLRARQSKLIVPNGARPSCCRVIGRPRAWQASRPRLQCPSAEGGAADLAEVAATDPFTVSESIFEELFGVCVRFELAARRADAVARSNPYPIPVRGTTLGRDCTT